MVKRYLIGVCGEYQHPSGDFVHWQDYKALHDERDKYKEDCEILANGMLKKLLNLKHQNSMEI